MSLLRLGPRVRKSAAPSAPPVVLWISRAHPGRTALLVGLLALSGVAEGVGLLTLLPLLRVAAGDAPGDGFAESLATSVLGLAGVRPSLGPLLGLIVAALALKGLFRWLAMRQVGHAVARVARDLRLRLLRSLLGARWSHLADAPAGALATSLGREAFWAGHAYRHGLAAAAALLQAAVYAAVVVLISWRLGALALLAAAAMGVGLGAFVRMARRAGVELTERSRAMASRLLDVVGGLKAIRAMGREEAYLRALERQAGDVEGAERRQIVAVESLHAFQEPLLALVLAPGVYVAFTAGGVPLPTLLVAVFLFHRLIGRAHAAQSEYQAMAAAEGAFDAIRAQIHDAEEAREAPAGGRPPPPLQDGIRLEGVSFGHGARAVLEDLDLEIPAGRFTALVGPSGAGKTTLLDLLVGLRAPDAGRILVDGVPLAEIDRRSWRRSVGYVPQEPVLLRDTVARNVALGTSDVAAADVELALRRAGAWDFVAALPGGLEADVGERGTRLSGGERQRIAVARALLLRPRLLVLDEPTSELDPAAEQDLVRTLLSLRGEVTVVAATHRGALSAFADAVHVLGAERAVRTHAL